MIRSQIEYDIIMNYEGKFDDNEIYDIIDIKKENHLYFQKLKKESKEIKKQQLKKDREDFLCRIKEIKESIDKKPIINEEKEEWITYIDSFCE